MLSPPPLPTSGPAEAATAAAVAAAYICTPPATPCRHGCAAAAGAVCFCRQLPTARTPAACPAAALPARLCESRCRKACRRLLPPDGASSRSPHREAPATALALQPPSAPHQVPAIGAPNAFIAPPRPDGEPDFLGLTVLDEPALRQSDPAAVALQLRHQLRLQSGGRGSAAASGAGQPPLGWLACPERKPQRLDDWIQQVEALHQV